MKKTLTTLAALAVTLATLVPALPASAMPRTSPTNPISLGHYATVQGWRIYVLGVKPEKSPDSVNGPIPKNILDEVYTLKATNVSKGPRSLIDLVPELLGSNHLVYDTNSPPGCYGGNEDYNNTVYPGGTIIDSECISVPKSDHNLALGVCSNLGFCDTSEEWFATSKNER